MRPYFDGRVSACRRLHEEHQGGFAGQLPDGRLRRESRRQHSEGGPETDTQGLEGDVRLDEHGVRERVQAVALAALHQIIEGLLQGGPDRVLPRVRLRVDIGRTRRAPDEQLDGMSPLPPVCEGPHPSTSLSDQDDENEEGFPALVVYERWDLWTPEAGLYESEGHGKLGIGDGNHRSEDGDSFKIECEGMGSRASDDAMITPPQHLKHKLEQLVNNYALEFNMDKWTVSGVLAEVAVDILFKEDDYPNEDEDFDE